MVRVAQTAPILVLSLLRHSKATLDVLIIVTTELLLAMLMALEWTETLQSVKRLAKAFCVRAFGTLRQWLARGSTLWEAETCTCVISTI
mgnify:CR=1 FL=1